MVPTDPRTGQIINPRTRGIACTGMVSDVSVMDSVTGANNNPGSSDVFRTRYGTSVTRPSTLHPNEFSAAAALGERLAVGVLYLLAGRAHCNFPTTNVAAPSDRVQVARTATPALQEADDRYFPFYVSWDRWERAVVPVLQDETNQLSLPYLADLLSAGRYDELVVYYHGKLLLSFQEQGYIPS